MWMLVVVWPGNCMPPLPWPSSVSSLFCFLVALLPESTFRSVQLIDQGWLPIKSLGTRVADKLSIGSFPLLSGKTLLVSWQDPYCEVCPHMGKRFRGCEPKCIKCFLFQVKQEGKVTVAEGPTYAKAWHGVRDIQWICSLRYSSLTGAWTGGREVSKDRSRKAIRVRSRGSLLCFVSSKDFCLQFMNEVW